MEKILNNTGSVIAIVIGIVAVTIIVAYLISKGKLNVKSDKFSIEGAKQNTKALLQECRISCGLLCNEFASEYIEKYPESEFRIRYISELVMNRLETYLHYNKITTDSDYIEMRFTDIKAIIDSNKIENVEYSPDFYKKLKESFVKIVKQIILIKKHYNED